jgi:alkylhydroperoxidase family enzyme
MLGGMPRLRQVPRSETDDPIVNGMYDLLFGKGVDPVAEQQVATATGSEGNWWTTYALSPDIMEHAVAGFVLYRSPDRKLDGVLRELAQARIGWAVGSKFVYSQHIQALRGLHADDAKIDDITAWQPSEAYTRVERAVLAYADAIAYDGGRVSDELFAVLREELSDEEIFELTYVSAMYLQHAVITRALRLEWDDRPEPVEEVMPPEEFDSEHYVAVGSTRDAKQRLRDARG